MTGAAAPWPYLHHVPGDGCLNVEPRPPGSRVQFEDGISILPPLSAEPIVQQREVVFSGAGKPLTD